MSSKLVTAVVAPLPIALPRGPGRVALQRLHARLAVWTSAQLCGARLEGLSKSPDDVPRPSNGWHWSLSHSATSVAGVVHDAPIGIDVEESRDVRAELVERVLGPGERPLFGAWGETAFLRAWTAKEAVLKEFGIGLAGLSDCRIAAVREREIEVSLRGESRTVRQFVESTRVVAVSAREPLEVAFAVRPWAFRRAEEPQWA